jgi:ABC-2 type transport system permease protein
MVDSLRLYFRYLGVSVRGQMQYRASFFMLAAGHFVTTGVEFLGVWALFARFGSLRGWRLPEVALLYALVNLSFALGEGIGRGFDQFPALVRSGDFDRLLLRPRATALQVAGQELQIMRAGRLLQAGIILLWAAASLGVAWTPAKALLVVAAVAGGSCMFYGLFVLQATFAFWTVETLELMNTVTYGGTESGQYPITIYRPWFRRFFTMVVPLICVNYLPAQVILERVDPLGSTRLMQWLSPGAGVLFLALTLQFWKLGERHYHSTGS